MYQYGMIPVIQGVGTIQSINFDREKALYVGMNVVRWSQLVAVYNMLVLHLRCHHRRGVWFQITDNQGLQCPYYNPRNPTKICIQIETGLQPKVNIKLNLVNKSSKMCILTHQKRQHKTELV